LALYKNLEERVPNPALDEKIIFPCGLSANSFFRDNFTACVVPTGNPAACDPLTDQNWKKEGIAWPSDLRSKFASRAPLDEETNISPFGFVLPDPLDEDFVVWMRTATLSTFTKLYRQIIDRNLEQNEILRVTISNNFDVTAFGGKKGIVISESSVLGGKDNFLGIAFIVIGLMGCINSVLIHWKGTAFSRFD